MTPLEMARAINAQPEAERVENITRILDCVHEAASKIASPDPKNDDWTTDVRGARRALAWALDDHPKPAPMAVARELAQLIDRYLRCASVGDGGYVTQDEIHAARDRARAAGLLDT